ncbi:dihydrolipoamide acetyltransferase family protein [Aquamicrobium zhengzhouense]|uniref:Dihydrolipoamide acetyltransferase component of pyruvate dehydrogenase complex n=1 Tax=Aquamicrobium zhengzhouense TaxID=2781738 RepID=A0ABS0S986_9HYPH|nr:dihydrolipoamide acetyltransferase family protein [Aquamicrobium zhengzhouense]MBI1619786.1 2-oxo acid dehydrogenase subunit E2 [Aquamicrobium zhengzhouense]
MAEFIIKMPDVGEGVAEAELVEWHVKIGDIVREDAILAAVMTDKATVEIPSPVEGTISWLGAEIGDTVAVGSPIVKIDVSGEVAVEAGGADTPTPNPSPQGGGELSVGPVAAEAPSAPAPSKAETATAKTESPSPLWGGARGGGNTLSASANASAHRPEGERPLASPAVRLRAKEAGIDLRRVHGSGPAGRITHDDLDQFFARGPQQSAPAGKQPDMSVEEIKVVGLRRKIAEKMARSKQRIPHITYVEEVNVDALEDLRARLNAEKRADRPRLTILPFLMRAMVKTIAEQPQINALYDDDAGIIHRHGGVHIGIAAQTPSGLVVPVVRHAEARDLWDCAVEVNRLADAAKSGTATREELSGSTITITSLGAMGGVATTPVINYPEVAIIGVNKIMVRPVWDGAQFVPAKMMNLSSSFDHRVIDGWDAAVFIQRIKALLETPALIFVE